MSDKAGKPTLALLFPREMFFDIIQGILTCSPWPTFSACQNTEDTVYGHIWRSVRGYAAHFYTRHMSHNPVVSTWREPQCYHVAASSLTFSMLLRMLGECCSLLYLVCCKMIVAVAGCGYWFSWCQWCSVPVHLCVAVDTLFLCSFMEFCWWFSTLLLFMSLLSLLLLCCCDFCS